MSDAIARKSNATNNMINRKPVQVEVPKQKE